MHSNLYHIINPILIRFISRLISYHVPRVELMCFLFYLYSFFVTAQTPKNLEYIDKIYEPQIHTVQIYPSTEWGGKYLHSVATPLHSQNLILEFDDLQDNKNEYYAKLIHCNYDWSKSTLMDLDFLENYNENPITDYALSINTYNRYVHYKYPIPSVKLPGNYLLVVYRENPSDIILSKRLLVYTNQIELTKNNTFIGTGTLHSHKQAIHFDLNYTGSELINPSESVHVTIRQNKRWDNAKINVQPSFINYSEKKLEYRLLDVDHLFDGGNEFRWVDFRSINYLGQNTAKIDRSSKPYHLQVSLDAPKTIDSYALYPDLNGDYIIENADVGDGALTGNYLNVHFYLKSPSPIEGDVYLKGLFNNYNQLESNKMTFNTNGYYECTQFLKQGLYNYQYEVIAKNTPPTLIEGSHYQTENNYEVLIYYRSFFPHTDLLIGYYLISKNPK